MKNELILLYQLGLAAAYRYLPAEQIPFPSGSNMLHRQQIAITDAPYIVLIIYNTLYCSGTLVRSKIVVTAASCLHKYHAKIPIAVKVGSNTITGNGQIIPVVEVKIHEYFQHFSKMDNDIAMLVLKDSVVFGPNIKKILLVEPEVALRVGTLIEISGWGGQNVQSKYTNMLLRSDMVVIDKSECSKTSYGSFLSPSNFCAKYQPESRLSDNGGPAIYRDLLVGILSFGANNKNEPNIAVLTNVSYFHRFSIYSSSHI